MAAFWDRAQSLIFGAAVGRAGSEAVTPVLEPVRQKAWSRNRVRVLDLGRLGELIARGFTTHAQAADEAARSGFDEHRLAAVAALAQTYPGLGELDEMANRKVLSDALVDKALARHGIPAEYQPAVKALFADLLDPPQIAAAIHRNIIPDPGTLVGDQPGTDRKVPIFPKVPIDALEEVEGQGLDLDRLKVLVGLQGLPMGPHEAAQALFRGIITHDDYLAAIAQGNTRNEWAAPIEEQTRQIPTSRDFFENALRGYHEFDWAVEQATRHGMSAEDALVIYQNQGRPMNVRRITQALARGGVFKPEEGEIKDPFLAAIVEGNLKPAYYDLEYANRYTLPSPFVMRQLTTSGVWDEAKTAERLKWSGWYPQDADEVAHAWATTKAVAQKEATVTDLLTLHDGGYLDESATLAAITDLGYPPEEAQTKLDLIDARRAASAKSTAISDLHAAFKNGDLDGPAVDAALNQLGVNPLAIGQIVASWQTYLDAFPPPEPAVTPPPVV